MNHHRVGTNTYTWNKTISSFLWNWKLEIAIQTKSITWCRRKQLSNDYVSERKKLCWWSSNSIVVTSLMLAKPPSTLVYKLREFMIDSPTSIYHGSDRNKDFDTWGYIKKANSFKYWKHFQGVHYYIGLNIHNWKKVKSQKSH